MISAQTYAHAPRAPFRSACLARQRNTPTRCNAFTLKSPIRITDSNREHDIGNAGSKRDADRMMSRRALFATMPALSVAGLSHQATASSIAILEDAKGIGSRGSRRGDLLLFHYVGRLEATRQIFDSTRGGLTYRDGGPGVLRPVAITLGGEPVPGICEGLQLALEGMSVGGKRTVRVPAALGFGAQTVLAPYGAVPGGSDLVYEIELLRLSAVGPDQLTQGIVKCGPGGANQQAENCGSISYAEFL